MIKSAGRSVGTSCTMNQVKLLEPADSVPDQYVVPETCAYSLMRLAFLLNDVKHTVIMRDADVTIRTLVLVPIATPADGCCTLMQMFLLLQEHVCVLI